MGQDELEVLMQVDVEFGPGVPYLTTRGKEAIPEIAKKLHEYPEVAVQVEGHASCKCNNLCTAQEVTAQRAALVVKALKDAGVTNKMTSVGQGCKMRIGRTVWVVQAASELG